MTDIEKILDDARAGILPFESWERITGESAAAYGAFCSYRDFGPERNIHKVVEKAEADTVKAGKRYRVWRLWSMRFRWRERAEAYDQYLDRMRQAELRKTIEEQGKVHRMVTGKMLQVVNKKLDMMDPGDLTQGTVREWVETAVKTEREILGVAAGKDKQNEQGGKPGRIVFAPEFENL
jgi:hypothetical protein